LSCHAAVAGMREFLAEEWRTQQWTDVHNPTFQEWMPVDKHQVSVSANDMNNPPADILFAAIFIFISVAVLWYNERRNIRKQALTDRVVKECVELDSCYPVDPGNLDKIVYTAGWVKPFSNELTDRLHDELTGVSAPPNALRFSVMIQVYKGSNDVDGRGAGMWRKYTYREHNAVCKLVDYDTAARERDECRKAVQAKDTLSSDDPRLAAPDFDGFVITKTQVRSLDDWQPLDIVVAKPQLYEDPEEEDTAGKRAMATFMPPPTAAPDYTVMTHDEHLYLNTHGRMNPQDGDKRVFARYVPAGEASFIGRQTRGDPVTTMYDGWSIAPISTKDLPADADYQVWDCFHGQPRSQYEAVEADVQTPASGLHEDSQRTFLGSMREAVRTQCEAMAFFIAIKAGRLSKNEVMERNAFHEDRYTWVIRGLSCLGLWTGLIMFLQPLKEVLAPYIAGVAACFVMGLPWCTIMIAIALGAAIVGTAWSRQRPYFGVPLIIAGTLLLILIWWIGAVEQGHILHRVEMEEFEAEQHAFAAARAQTHVKERKEHQQHQEHQK